MSLLSYRKEIICHGIGFFYEMIMYNNYIDKMFVGEKLKQIKKRKEEVAVIDKTHVYIRGPGGYRPRSQRHFTKVQPITPYRQEKSDI